MSNDFINKVIDKEIEITSAMGKNALLVLDNSIIEMSMNKNNNSIIFAAMHLQISIELFLKNYICKVYGFQNILTSKYKKMRENNIHQYFNELKAYNIKTLGFNELKEFLENKDDYFGSVIKSGRSYLYDSYMEYDYLEGLFEKFQNIRNNFIHLGADLKEEDFKWLSMEFYVMIIYFISTILDKDKDVDIFYELEESDFYITSIDRLRNKLSEKALIALMNDKEFEEELSSIAEDLSESNQAFRCTRCGKSTFALNIRDGRGQSKCLYCGLCLDGYYCECAICKDETVMYDELNIEINNNVIRGKCFGCDKILKVYRCPSCGSVYSYDLEHPINLESECCKKNFKDKPIWGVDYNRH